MKTCTMNETNIAVSIRSEAFAEISEAVTEPFDFQFYNVVRHHR